MGFKELIPHKILSNIKWLLVDKIVRLFFGVLISIWLSRYLGPEQFGQLSYSLAYILLFSSFAGMGIQGIVLRDIVQFPNFSKSILGTSFIITLFSGVFSYILVLLSLLLFKQEQQSIKIIISIIGSMLLFKASDVVLYFFESKVESKYVIWVQNIGVFLFSIIKVLMIFLKMPLISFAWVIALEYFVIALLIIIVFNYTGIRILSLRFDLIRAKAILKESIPLVFSSIAIAIYMKSDQIILGKIIDSRSVGIYSAALRLSEFWFFIPAIIVSSVAPGILQLKNKNIDIYHLKLKNLFSVLNLICLIVAILITIFSNYLIEFLYGKDYLLASHVLSVHIWSGLFVALGTSSSYWYLAENKTKLYFQRTLLGAISNFLLNIILITRFGVVGAAYASLIAQILTGLVFDVFHKSTRELFVLKLNSFLFLKNWRSFRETRNN